LETEGQGVLGQTRIEYKIVESYKTRPGFDLGLGINKGLFKGIDINLGIGFSFVQFKRSIILEIENFDRIKMNQLDNLGKTKVSYFNIPIDVKYNLFSDKIKIGAGINCSILLFSQQVQKNFI
jgi:hypothetical protein